MIHLGNERPFERVYFSADGAGNSSGASSSSSFGLLSATLSELVGDLTPSHTKDAISDRIKYTTCVPGIHPFVFHAINGDLENCRISLNRRNGLDLETTRAEFTEASLANFARRILNVGATLLREFPELQGQIAEHLAVPFDNRTINKPGVKYENEIKPAINDFFDIWGSETKEALTKADILKEGRALVVGDLKISFLEERETPRFGERRHEKVLQSIYLLESLNQDQPILKAPFYVWQELAANIIIQSIVPSHWSSLFDRIILRPNTAIKNNILVEGEVTLATEAAKRSTQAVSVGKEVVNVQRLGVVKWHLNEISDQLQKLVADEEIDAQQLAILQAALTTVELAIRTSPSDVPMISYNVERDKKLDIFIKQQLGEVVKKVEQFINQRGDILKAYEQALYAREKKVIPAEQDKRELEIVRKENEISLRESLASQREEESTKRLEEAKRIETLTEQRQAGIKAEIELEKIELRRWQKELDDREKKIKAQESNS